MNEVVGNLTIRLVFLAAEFPTFRGSVWSTAKFFSVPAKNTKNAKKKLLEFG